MAVARLMPIINMTEEQRVASRANNRKEMERYRLTTDQVAWHDYHLKLLNATRNLFLNTGTLADLKSWLWAIRQAMAYNTLKQAQSRQKTVFHQAELQMYWGNFLLAHIELLDNLEKRLHTKEDFQLYEYAVELGKEINAVKLPQKPSIKYSNLKKGERYNPALDGDEINDDRMMMDLIEHQGNLEPHQAKIKQLNRQRQLAFCKTYCCLFSRSNQSRSAEVQHDGPVFSLMR